MFLVLGIANELLRNRISHGANRFGLVIMSAVLKLETTIRLLFVSPYLQSNFVCTRIGIMFLFSNFCSKLEYIAEDRSRKISKFHLSTNKEKRVYSLFFLETFELGRKISQNRRAGYSTVNIFYLMQVLSTKLISKY